MAEIETAKLFKHGGSQAVRLPKEFRLPGTEVRVRRLGRGVLLEPMEFDIDAWLAAQMMSRHVVDAAYREKPCWQH
jgi:antitoxin VapB